MRQVVQCSGATGQVWAGEDPGYHGWCLSMFVNICEACSGAQSEMVASVRSKPPSSMTHWARRSLRAYAVAIYDNICKFGAVPARW